MRLRVNQISLRLDYEKQDVLAAIARLLSCREDELDKLVLIRRSVDARHKDKEPRFVLSVEVDYLGKDDPPFTPGRVVLAVEPESMPVLPHVAPREHSPIVVGAGPAYSRK